MNKAANYLIKSALESLDALANALHKAKRKAYDSDADVQVLDKLHGFGQTAAGSPVSYGIGGGLIGGGLGAGLGALAGAVAGQPGKGWLIGGGAGIGLGSLLGATAPSRSQRLLKDILGGREQIYVDAQDNPDHITAAKKGPVSHLQRRDLKPNQKELIMQLIQNLQKGK